MANNRCNYPNCNCPLDHPGTEVWCARGLPTPPASQESAGEADGEEDYQLGKRDGYEEAVQDIDVLTGGDGEYCYCTDGDPDRHTPDASSMKQRIADRYAALTAELAEVREQRDSLRDECERLREALTPKPPREGIYPWAVALEPTARNAQFWIEGARKEERKGHAILCAEQAVNAWKNAAYHYAEKLAALSASGRECAAPAIAKQSEGE